ncbi:hypothetical protein ACTFIW_000360 [Dictyostelium discoideum]
MEDETTNKKLKTNLSENNDNNKIIVLPLIIQKHVLQLLYEEYDPDYYDLIINFKLELYSFEEYEPTNLENIEKEEFKFKTNLFEELNPKYLKIKSLHISDSGRSHLLQYHSISKLNQNYESVEIIDDFIPLYALYRFLQSPNLHTLKFHLQLHFISSIYDNQINNNKYNSYNNINNINSDCESDRDSSKYSGFGKDKIELDFNEMDNFKFINFGNIGNYENGGRLRYKVHDDIKFYIDNGINEDDQIYCSFSVQEDSCIEIPPYSMSLWKQCLKLLSTNSTITDLSITHDCGDECGWDENSLYNENFFNDFMNSLANNKTIKTLTLNFNFTPYGNENTNIDLIKKSIASMLDQNTTLESINIIFDDIDQIQRVLK